ncbi:MAG: hypothetical protein AB2392_03385 [Neobacillus sp.]
MDESKFYAYCLQGDVTSAYEYLRSVPDKNKKYQLLETKYERRFFKTDKPVYRFKSEDSWIRKVLLNYYQYFTFVLTGRDFEEAEKQLITGLKTVIPIQTDNLDVIEDMLEGLFEEKGYEFQGGVTPPFRGPYIWKTTEKKEFTVELPHHIQPVTVYFLSDFLMLGWLHFATYGEKYAGGWAKSDGLYYVAERTKKKSMNLYSPEFQVSYLKHEAQHLSDYSRYPNLTSKDLEYRAKLIELIYELKSHRLIKKFFYEQKNDPRLPHPYSSFCIMKRLSECLLSDNESPSLRDWKQVSSELIRHHARELFEEHTEQLDEKGEEVVGVI